MDNENKPTDTEAKPEIAASADTKTESPSAAPASSTPTALSQPKSKMGPSILLFIFVAIIVAGVIVYVLAGGTKKSTEVKEESPSPTAAKQEKATSKISGNVKTDSHDLDYVLVDISEDGAQKAARHDVRYIPKPQTSVEYTYSFDDLKPDITYSVIVEGCSDKDSKKSCVTGEKVLTCSGRIPTERPQTCLIRGDGSADFFLDKNLFKDFESNGTTPSPSASPTTAPTNTP